MIIILKKGVPRAQINDFVKDVKKLGVGVQLNEGTQTVLGLLGDTSKINPRDFLVNDIVEGAERVSAPYKLASRSFHPEDTVITVGAGQEGVTPCVIGDGTTVAMIAGPCSVENEEQILSAARAVKNAGAKILRGGTFKPRTSPYSFQGLGNARFIALSAVSFIRSS